MAPSSTMIRTRRTTTRSTTRAESAAATKAKATKPRRAQHKMQQKQKQRQKQHVELEKQPKINNVEDLLPSTSSITTTNLLLLDHDDDTSSSSSSSSSGGGGCSTPKAERFRIPEIVTCPPAPKKRRVVSNCSSLQRNPSSRPIAFFAPPDLELFFFFALRDISV